MRRGRSTTRRTSAPIGTPSTGLRLLPALRLVRDDAVGTAGSIKVEVTPKDAKVYVDGYFAGIVDDSTGTFQRLRMSPGKHEVVLFQEGYHLLKQTMYLSPNNTYKIKGELTKLAPGDAPEQAPTPPPMAPPSAQARLLPDPFGEPPQQGAPPPPQGQVPQAPPNQRAIEMRGPSTDSRFGRLAIRVQPQGAEVTSTANAGSPRTQPIAW